MAQNAVGRGERRPDPPAPVVVREDRRDREDTLLDDHEPPRGQPALDGAVAQPERVELRARNAVELLTGKLCDPSVPHHPL